MPDELAVGPALSSPAVPARPGALRRLGAGAWHVLAGFGLLLRRPALWPWAALPALLTLVCLLAGLFGALYSLPWVEAAVVPGPARVGRGLAFVLLLLVWTGTFLAGLVLGLGAALLLSAPALEQLSKRVDTLVRGRAVDTSKGLGWEVAQSFRGILFFLAAAPGVLLLGLVPLVGPPLAIVWGGYAPAFQQTDAALARRGLDFAARRAWHRYWRLESLGFGVTGLVTLVVPLANLLVVPALTVGGTLMVLELRDQLIPPDLTGPVPRPEPEDPPSPS